jgi:hypothetical protein
VAAGLQIRLNGISLNGISLNGRAAQALKIISFS